jgi:lysophospholipase L1-like esterase
MKKVSLSDGLLKLEGLPWYERNGKHMWRLPCDLKDSIGRDLWEVSTNSSGARIRFASDTTMLGMVVKYENVAHSDNMCLIGSTGIDVYVDNHFWNCIFPKGDGEMESFFFKNAERKLREYTINLPLYHDIEVLKVVFDDDAEIKPPAPYALPRPVVFYGTSITQGGCASRAGLSYQGMLSRELNIDYVNLGFSGLGKGEPQVARAMAEIDAACYVLDYAQNNETIEEFEEVYLPFIMEIRKVRPDTPIIITTPIFYTSENWNVKNRKFQNDRRDVVRKAYKARLEAGDGNIHLLEWNEVIGFEDGEGQVDGAHPNDLGFFRMSQGMKGLLKKVLAL